MNKRLDGIYTELSEEHRQPFLQNELVLDTMWEKPIEGITLQIGLSVPKRNNQRKHLHPHDSRAL